MKIIKPSVELLTQQSGEDVLKQIEIAARTCYKSEDKITEGSAIKLVEMLLRKDHLAMIEFGHLMMKFICDRGVSHEIVRHRLFSFAQESTRYCNYSKDKFGNELTFIEPCFWGYKGISEGSEYQLYKKNVWMNSMANAESDYFKLIELGATPQEARSVLPNSLKTEIVIMGNFREWRHFFQLRTSPYAHPQMQEVAKIALKLAQSKIPLIFDNIED